VRAWCAWCDQHGLPCLPARGLDVVAFLAAERGRGLRVNTVELRRAAIRYLHCIAGCPVPTAEARVSEAMAGMRRAAADAGQLPGKKLAATADILRQILAPIEADLAGLRDRALLLVGFAGALRRAELAAIRVEHLEPCERGLRLTLPHSKGERTGRGVTVALPYGTTELCPIRALRSWQEAAGIAEGAVFRRIWIPPSGRDGSNTPLPRVGALAIDAGTVARITRPALPWPASTPRSWAATASSAARSAPAWTATSIPHASSSSGATKPMRCSTNTSNAVTRSTAIRSTASCDHAPSALAETSAGGARGSRSHPRSRARSPGACRHQVA
jgi:hypothetical protein